MTSTPRLGKVLRERVEESPFDDAPRLAYADYLIEKSDPRGQFIALSFDESRRPLDKTENRKVTTILKVHERSWLGPIMDATIHRRYAKGFLDECTVNPECNDPDFEAALGHHAWSTVRSLSLAFTERGADLAMHPCMRALRRVLAVGVEQLLQLAMHPTTLGIEEVDAFLPPRGQGLSEEAHRIATSPGLAGVKRLRLQNAQPRDLAWLAGTALARNLEVLNVSAQWPASLDAWTEALETHGIHAVVYLGFATIARGADGRWSAVAKGVR